MVIYQIFVFGADLMPCLLQIALLVSEEKTLNIFSIGSYVKIKSRHGGHLEFPISKRFTGLVQNHPMIIPAKSQFNKLNCDFAGMIIGWSCTKLVNRLLIENSRWPSQFNWFCGF
jgi:hypothetical protein